MADVPRHDWPALRVRGALVRAQLLTALRTNGAQSMDQLHGQFVDLRLTRRQLHGYLTVLREQGVVARLDVALWAAVDNPPPPRVRTRICTKRAEGEVVRVARVAASQVGMVRDELVAALFGPGPAKR